MSPFNAFVKSNISDVITGVYPTYAIDFTKVIVSKGTLTGVDTGTAVVGAGHKVNFSWVDNSGNGDALATDKAMVLIINNTKKSIVQDMITKTRADANNSITVPATWIGNQVFAYLAFITPTNDKVSNSTFLAPVTIIA